MQIDVHCSDDHLKKVVMIGYYSYCCYHIKYNSTSKMGKKMKILKIIRIYQCVVQILTQ